MRLVLRFVSMERRIESHGQILVVPLVFIIVVLFLSIWLARILFEIVFGKNFLVGLSVAS